MIERDSCYFCTSTYQLFAILSLAYRRKERADLYIDPQFSQAEQFAERIRKIAVFQNVVVIDSKGIYGKYMSAGPGLRNHLQIANTYLHVREIARQIILDGVVYRNIFLSSKAYLPRMVQLSYIKEGKDFNTFYFDDGAGTYEKDRAYRISRADKAVRTMLFGKRSVFMDYDRFVFSPDLYHFLNPDQDYAVRQIDRFWEEQWGKDVINQVFGITNEPRIDESVIVLDQPKDELFNSDGIAVLNGLYKNIVDSVGYDNVVIKKHPRSSTKDFEGFKYFENQGIPFELYCLNTDMGRKTIISYSSTAVVTPKLLFGQEPFVIVLSKLIQPSTNEKNLFVDFFEVVKKTYKNPDKFFIPDSRAEFESIIASMRKYGGIR